MALPVASAFAHLIPGASATRAPLGDLDKKHLARALREAHRSVGRTTPNPPVGAVVVKDGAVIAVGNTEPPGKRHAEIVALDAVAGKAKGAVLYVSLEPCNHHGRTPPCTDRVLAEGIARVVVGALDPNPRVHGQGIAQLRHAGVKVDVAAGALADECAALVAPFATALVDKRLYTVLKVATSLDGRVAAPTGRARWITGEGARLLVHRLRDAVDAVIVGAGTVIADDPELTVRALPGRDPRRVVVDARLRTQPTARVYSPSAPSLVVHADADAARVDAFDAAGVTRAALPAADGHVDLHALLRTLAERGATSALIEGGPGLATALLARGLVDELWWMTAPLLIGGDGIPAIHGLGLGAPSEGPRFQVVHRAITGDDAITVMRPR